MCINMCEGCTHMVVIACEGCVCACEPVRGNVSERMDLTMFPS
jgi:hypothetical protein